MPVERNWRAGPMVFRAPYYNELLAVNGGFLPPDLSCHALWHYYCIAASSYDKEKNQPIYEGDPDADFHAERVFCAIANMHGVHPQDMMNFWPAVRLQVRMLGGDADLLPPKYRFGG